MTEYEALYIGKKSEIEAGGDLTLPDSTISLHEKISSSPEEAARLARQLIAILVDEEALSANDYLVATRKVEDHSDLQLWRIVVELKPKVTLLTPYMIALKEEGEL